MTQAKKNFDIRALGWGLTIKAEKKYNEFKRCFGLNHKEENCEKIQESNPSH